MSSLQKTAKMLLARRDAGNDLAFLFQQMMSRQAFFILLYIAIPFSLWRMDYTMLAIASASFFLGAKIRDLRWLFTLHQSWGETRQLLDWPRIEKLAGTLNMASAEEASSNDEGAAQ